MTPHRSLASRPLCPTHYNEPPRFGSPLFQGLPRRYLVISDSLVSIDYKILTVFKKTLFTFLIQGYFYGCRYFLVKTTLMLPFSAKKRPQGRQALGLTGPKKNCGRKSAERKKMKHFYKYPTLRGG